jgi:predicted RNA-binding protein with TRAM domain
LYGEDETQQTTPIAEGEEYEVKIEDLGKEGDGITRVQGFVVFVPDTKVGDEIKIRITSVRKRFAFAEKI